MTQDTDERVKLALADARDKAYERLHALAGSRATPPRWDDIAMLLRERDELYQQLRSPAGHAEREALREECAKIADRHAAGWTLIPNGLARQDTAEQIAAEIRALSSEPPADTEDQGRPPLWELIGEKLIS